jgi:acetyltransferase-like isoleucine patch superfamily enzyme
MADPLARPPAPGEPGWHPTPWKRDGRLVEQLRLAAETFYNAVVCHVPVRSLRMAWLRASGATLGEGAAVFWGTTVFNARDLVIGARSVVSFRCVLDARGGLRIGEDVVVASDVQLITGGHDVDDPGFAAFFRPVEVGNRVWLTSRATVLAGVRIGDGAVVAACALVTEDVPAFAVVGGVPARVVRERSSELTYRIGRHPRWY